MGMAVYVGMDGKPKAPTGYNEWVKKGNRVNISTGCENDCVYCYAKLIGYDQEWAVRGQWHNMVLRQKEVEKGRRRRNGRLAFPTSHDITPSILKPYLIVLGKLLRAGNEILIVSKPRDACIRSICESFRDYLEQILFRFTIGATDNEILSYWEPNAPTYEERRACLRHAYEDGFRTSVSVEPMLEAYNIEVLVNELMPFVNDAIWIGKMEHLDQLKRTAGYQLAERIAEIEHFQRDEMIWAIYNQYRDNPKIKWKNSIKKVVGLPPAPEPGMDV
jgi:DNA repair photolyase